MLPGSRKKEPGIFCAYKAVGIPYNRPMPKYRNTFSSAAEMLSVVGLLRTDVPGALSAEMVDMADEVFTVPERPEDFRVRIQSARPELAVPVSGGLESTVLYFRAVRAGRKPKAFYVLYGHPYARKEQAALIHLGINPQQIKIERLSSMPATMYWKHIIPARNFIILSAVAEEILGGEIWFGVSNGEMPVGGGDKSETFFNMVNHHFNRLPFPVKVEIPLQTETKVDLVRWWLRAGISKELLAETVSCFSDSKEKHCGACQSCLRKYIAFAANGLELKTDVDVRVGCAQYIEKYKRVMGGALKTESFGKYSRRRCEQDLQEIERL